MIISFLIIIYSHKQLYNTTNSVLKQYLLNINIKIMAIKKIASNDISNIFLACYQFKRVVKNRIGLSALELSLLMCSCVAFKNGVFNKKRLWFSFLGNTPFTAHLNVVFIKLYSMGYYTTVKECIYLGGGRTMSATFRVSESGFELIAKFEALLLKEANKLRDADYSFKNGNEKKKANRESLKTFNDY